MRLSIVSSATSAFKNMFHFTQKTSIPWLCLLVSENSILDFVPWRIVSGASVANSVSSAALNRFIIWLSPKFSTFRAAEFVASTSCCETPSMCSCGRFSSAALSLRHYEMHKLPWKDFQYKWYKSLVLYVFVTVNERTFVNPKLAVSDHVGVFLCVFRLLYCPWIITKYMSSLVNLPTLERKC